MIAVVTGASSGFGQEFVRQFDSKGYDEIWVIARRAERLNQLKDEVKTPVRPIPMDLSDMNSINELINTTDIDFISMQRPFVFNPTFLSQWKDGREVESLCHTCNNCYWKKTSTCHIIAEDE